jgi:hypothetical protein
VAHRFSTRRVGLARALQLAALAVEARAARYDAELDVLTHSPALDLMLGGRRLLHLTPAEADDLHGHLSRMARMIQLAA